MYSAYQLHGLKFEDGSDWLETGRRIEEANLLKVRKSLETFLSPTGEVDAEKMMKEWFSGISADVFISHSRADKDLALTLAGWLSAELEVSSFVDSCAWGHASMLLKQIDDAFCKIGGTTYSYFHSTVTASHVHLMLSTALSQMLDRCECVFFLNSEHSVKSISVQNMAESDEEHITESPWLFYELSMLRLLRRRKKEEHRLAVVKKADFSVEARAYVPAFNYPVNLEALPSLGNPELNRWARKWNGADKTNNHAFDTLYEIKSPDCRKEILG